MKQWLILLSIGGLLFFAIPSHAQTEPPTPAPVATAEATPVSNIPLVHVVEEGENLTLIAEQNQTTVEALLLVNHLSADAILYIGQELIIPGGQGDAIVTVYRAHLGDTLKSVAMAFNTTSSDISRENRLINPYQSLQPGETLAITSRTGSPEPQTVTGEPYVVQAGESLLSIAVAHNLSPLVLAQMNGLPYPAYLFAGQRLRLPGERPYRDLPGEWVDVSLHPDTIIPGSTVAISVTNLLPGRPSGTLGGQPLHFVPQGKGFVALIGLDAFAEPGDYALELAGEGEQPWRPMSLNIPVGPGNYGTQAVNVGPELNELLDPAVRAADDAQLEPYYSAFTDTIHWQGVFQYPMSTTVVTAGYGDGRSYNGGPITIFHTGIDFGGAVGTPVFAPAAGVVVFNDTTRLRGHVLIIDHGMGVMSGFYHLSETFVPVGTAVAAGQQVGALGSTGLSSGPHLHWDVRILNVPVNPLQWLSESFP